MFFILMFWPLLIAGYYIEKYSLGECAALAAVWIGLLACVLIKGASGWYFIVPATLLTIYMIGTVLGWDTPAPGRGYGRYP